MKNNPSSYIEIKKYRTNLKLLYIANALFPQNVANRIQTMNICEAFAENNIELSLLTFKSKEFKNKKHLFKYYNIKKEFNLVLLKPFRSYVLRDLRLFFNFLRLRKKYNFVFTRTLIPALLIKFFFKDKKVVYELHDNPNQKLEDFFLMRKLRKFLFSKLDLLVITNPNLYNKYKKIIFCNFIILPNGVNTKKFNIKICKKEARKKLGLPTNKKTVMYTGGLQKWKGVDTLIRAFDRVDRDVILCIVGGTKEEIEEYKKKIKNKNIYFIGFQKQEKIPIYLKAADVLVLPNSSKKEISRKYTSPLKLFEYMASKRPIVASDLPSIRNIVSDEEVLFFTPNNPKDLALKIQKLLNNKKFAIRITENAYKNVQKYDLKKKSPKYYLFF